MLFSSPTAASAAVAITAVTRTFTLTPSASTQLSTSLSSPSSSAVSKVLSVLSAYRGPIIGAVMLYYLLQKLRVSMKASHNVRLMPPVDPSLFPQYFRNKNGLWIHTRRWEVAKPRALVFLCHGYAEHVGRYEHIARVLNQHQFSVYGMDHQGHGLSQGERAHVEKFKDYVDDYLQFVELTQKGMEPLPVFLLGHSMGGTIAIEVMRASYSDTNGDGVLVSRNDSAADEKKSSISDASTEWKGRVWPWRGAILSSPALMADPHTATPLMKSLGTFFSKWLPKLPLMKLDISYVSRIESVVLRYLDDPLNYCGGMKARWAEEMMTTFDTIRANMKNIHWPFFIFHGTADKVTMPEGSELFYSETSSKQKRIKLYQGGYHELFNDINKEQVFTDLLAWLDENTEHTQ